MTLRLEKGGEEGREEERKRWIRRYKKGEKEANRQ